MAGFAFLSLGVSRDSHAQGTLRLESFLDGSSTPLTFSSDQNSVPAPAGTLNVVPDNNPTLGQLGNGTTSTPIVIPVTGGNISVFASLSTSTAQPAGTTPAELTSSSVHVQNNSSVAHTIDLRITDIGFTVPSGNPIVFTNVASGSIDPINGNTSVGGAAATVKAFADAGNAPFGMTFASLPTQSFGPAAAGSPLFSYNVPSTNSANFNHSGPYSQTLEVIFTLPPNTELTGRQDVQIATGPAAVPEPAPIVLALAGLPALAIGYLRSRRRSQQA
jgi:hypothetical protein